jgi:hypothetical protein
MTNKKLKAALLNKLGITPQRLWQRTEALRLEVPMTTEEATYCIAHREGLRLHKFLDSETVARVRQLVSSLRPMVQLPSAQRPRAKLIMRLKEVRVGRNLSISDPILPGRIIAEAKEMAEEVYPVLYIFENSVREVLRRVLSREIGADWWERCAPDGVRRTVAGRMNEERDNPWHGARAADPIFYTDIKDLVSIVRNREAWPKIQPILGRIEWFSELINCIGASRNPVAHMNPIVKNDRQRVIVNFRDWESVVRAKRSLIPSS